MIAGACSFFAGTIWLLDRARLARDQRAFGLKLFGGDTTSGDGALVVNHRTAQDARGNEVGISKVLVGHDWLSPFHEWKGHAAAEAAAWGVT